MKRIAIIGSGVVGLSAAWYCRQRGYDVTVIERNGRTRDNCSFGNAGYITPSHFIPLAAPGMVAMGLRMMKNPESPFYVRPRLTWEFLSWGWRFWRACTPARVDRAAPLLRDLNLASRACYDEFANSWGNDFELERRGLVNVFQTQAKLDHEIHVAEKAHQLGVQAEVLDAAGVRRLNPGFQMDTIGGVYFPQDWHLTPPRFMATILAKLEAASCQFAWNADVTGFDVRGRRVHAVKTSAGEIGADEVVLAAGAWSPVVSRSLGLSLPMQAGKGYSLTMPNAPERPTVATLLTEARVAVTPMGANVRFGGTMEMSGLNLDVNPARVRGIIQSACRILPAFRPEHFEGITPWRGHRPCSPDGLPYLGRTKRYDNLTVATGHAMMGMSLGPISGKIVDELIGGEKPAIDLTLVSPDRY
jgi:D-amino-acid dehydrogenase